MSQLAIRGHESRGKEVIELLEMLGGEDTYQINARRENYVYFIDEDKIIRLLKIDQLLPNQFIVFTLEEFLEKFPYKVGDKVKTYDRNLKDFVNTEITSMGWFDDEVLYVAIPYHNIRVKYLQPYKEETMEEKRIPPYMDYDVRTKETIGEELMPKIDFSKYCKDKYLLDMGDYEIKVEDGKTYVVRKKPQYPKSYKECCEVLGLRSDCHLTLDLNAAFSLNAPATHDLSVTKEFKYVNKLEQLRRLLICRGAYWKIAGQEMELGKPWEPEFRSGKKKYCIMTEDNKVISATVEETNRILVFPSEEMRDAFFKSFKDLVEQCKELL